MSLRRFRVAAITAKDAGRRTAAATCSTAANTRPMRLRITLALWAALLAGAAHAALFDDDEARKQIFQLRNQVEARPKAIEERLSAIDARLGQLDSSGQNRVVDLAQLIELLRQDVAKLRGQIEVLSNQTETLERRQKDLGRAHV